MPNIGAPRHEHSGEYFRKIFEAAARTDINRYNRVTAQLRGKTVQVIIEGATDEQFYLVGDANGMTKIMTQDPGGKTQVFLRLPPGTIRNILEGGETPVEAFFMGHLRAKGHTRDLNALHTFFLGMAEIAVAAPEILDILEAFDSAKQRL